MILRAFGIAGLALTMLWGLMLSISPAVFFVLMLVSAGCWILGIVLSSKSKRN